MTKQEQKEFIEFILDDAKEKMLKAIEHIPDNWDGFELRQWVYDYMEKYNFLDMGKTRKRAYLNEIRINPYLY